MFNKRKSVKYYNKDIREYTGSEYTWQELNCFYRPFAIAMGRERHNMFLLLVSLYMTHKNVDNGKMLFNRLHPSLQFFDNELKDILNAIIKVEEYSSEKDMYRKAETALSEQYVVVVPYDLYVMPYSRNYMEQHHRHYIMLKGFDSEKRIFYILDNMQNNLGESTSYTDFMMQYRQMYIGADAFHRTYDAVSSSKPYFWKIKCMGGEAEIKRNTGRYLIKILEGFISGDIEPYYVEWDMAGRASDGHMLDMVEQINQRNVYYGEFIKFINSITGDYNYELESMAENLKKNWNIIKIQLMRGHNEIVGKLEENIGLEKEWHKDILNILKGITNYNTGNKIETGYLIVNELNADMRHNGEEWEIKLSPDMVYDTWELKDDACQILYPFNDTVSGIEAHLKKKSVTAGSGFHIGIILKSDKGEKILYGNSRNIHLAAFKPGGENYELYQSDYAFEEEDIFLVKFGDMKDGSLICTFYIKGNNKGQWEEVCSADIGFIPDYVGVFVKSWERCECEVAVSVNLK